MLMLLITVSVILSVMDERSLGSSGSRGAKDAMPPPPSPVKISHKKDGCQRWPHRFHVSRPPPYPAAGSTTVRHNLP